ncbi:unnamed protein product [Blepharisma stoltei]|uniref:LAGLIDADG homing endonuclease n=1 Tax=Blepharisma stoltei TaxID=1481888 RepID=A0AAU9JZJ8_9CILI|nr:unnamed protein product [Blepharisma stoltei]
MRSIFESTDEIKQLNYEFWMPYESSNDIEVFTDQLYEVSKNKIKIGAYTLTKTKLIKHKPIKKSVPIEWKLVIPFIDEINNSKRFGFRLGHTSHYRDFFVSTQEKLDLWLSFFSNICIMTDVENDFNFIKRIGKGKSAHVFLTDCIENSQKYAIKSINK